MQLTLQGGARGIHQKDCYGYQTNGAQLSSVTFRDMAIAGLVFTNLYAWDNNMVSHVNWANIDGPAFHQEPAGAARIDGKWGAASASDMLRAAPLHRIRAQIRV